jgi:hypothetical protein
VNFYKGSFVYRRFFHFVLMLANVTKKLPSVLEMTDKSLLEPLYPVFEFNFGFDCVKNVDRTTSARIKVPSLLP